MTCSSNTAASKRATSPRRLEKPYALFQLRSAHPLDRGRRARPRQDPAVAFQLRPQRGSLSGPALLRQAPLDQRGGHPLVGRAALSPEFGSVGPRSRRIFGQMPRSRGMTVRKYTASRSDKGPGQKDKRGGVSRTEFWAYGRPRALRSWARAEETLYSAWTFWAAALVRATCESPNSMMLPTPV